MIADKDLTECDKEPIHIPSAIQPHGFFIAIHPQNNTVVAVSANIGHFFTFSAQAMIDQPLEIFFPVLNEWILHGSSDGSTILPQVFSLSHTRNISRYIISVHSNENYLIIEGEAAEKADLFPDFIAQSVIQEATGLSSAKSVQSLSELGVLALQRLSGFGRVMLYRFDEEYNGCVTAEAKTSNLHSYLDHHFPAGDIPVQARELYKKNLIRFIPTAEYEPVPVYGRTADPIDMSYSILRSVSPIHLEYLRNMEVNASMSLSIIVDGELWGLFACHHPEPKSLALTIRRYCEMFIRLFNALIEEKIANEKSQSIFQLQNRYSTLKKAFKTLSTQTDIHDAFQNLGSLWLDGLESDGVSLVQHDRVTKFGTVPEAGQIQALCEQIDSSNNDLLYATDSLSTAFPELDFSEPVAGVLRMIISQNPRTQILWFRNEWSRELKWAGDPEKKSIETAQRINPRLSFETFIIEQKGKSRTWDESHFMAAMLYQQLGSIIELDAARKSIERQNQLLIQQEKMAMMGEMIGAIAHQWNQPLNALSLLISGLSELIDTSDQHTLSEIKLTGMEKIHFMRDTIESFRNFFKPDKAVELFSMTKEIQKVGEQLFPHFKTEKISLFIDSDVGLIEGYPNEFKQIIVSLFANSYEAFLETKKENPWIRCTIEYEQTTIKLYVCDNGGGIDPTIMEQIFLPHFSTKIQNIGRGIGLYLAKLIMEEHFEGKISVYNEKEGACFLLEFKSPRSKE